jgi:hypothetical protein
MRNLFLLCILCATIFTTKAQPIIYYQFENDSMVYTPLVGGTSVNNGVVWQDASWTMPLGFQFKLFTDSSSTLGTDSNFNTGAVFAIKPLNFLTPLTAMIPFSGEIQSGGTTTSTSPVTYLTTGVAPNRIFKLQYENAVFQADITSKINFQVWLHEGKNYIETHFGPATYNSAGSLLYAPNFGPGMSIADRVSLLNGVPVKVYFISDDPTAPKLDSTSAALTGVGSVPGLDDHVAENQVYRFKPAVPALPPASLESALQLNQCSIVLDKGVLHIANTQTTPAQLTIYDMQGKIVSTLKVDAGITPLEVRTLVPGAYIADFMQDGKRRLQQFAY